MVRMARQVDIKLRIPEAVRDLHHTHPTIQLPESRLAASATKALDLIVLRAIILLHIIMELRRLVIIQIHHPVRYRVRDHSQLLRASVRLVSTGWRQLATKLAGVWLMVVLMSQEAGILLTTPPTQVARPPVTLHLLEVIIAVARLMIQPLVAVVTELVPEALTGMVANVSRVHIRQI